MTLLLIFPLKPRSVKGAGETERVKTKWQVL